MECEQNREFQLSYTSFEWALQSCSSFVRTDQIKVLKSKLFNIPGTVDQFGLNFYIKNTKDYRRMSVTKRVKLLDYFINSNRIKKTCKDILKIIEPIDSSLREKIFIWGERPMNFVIDGHTLIIIFELKYIKKCQYTNKLVLKNFHEFYINEQFFDATIVINDERIRSHSLVLAAISPLFSGMLAAHFATNRDRIIDFSNDPDLDPEIIKGVLDYAYGLKSVYDLKHMAVVLLVVAHRYGISVLKQPCEQYIGEMIDNENLYTYAIFANMWACDLIKTKIADIKYNRKSPRQFEGEDKTIITDMVMAMINKHMHTIH